MIIIGIDPGLRNTGFGIIEICNNKPCYVIAGVVATNSSEQLPQRLAAILAGLDEIIIQYKPQVAAIEKVFVNSNPQTTLLLGQARGVAIAACVQKQLATKEYTALQIKKAIVGYGHAHKVQVSKMVQTLLHLNKAPKADAADALACALTAYYTKPVQYL